VITRIRTTFQLIVGYYPNPLHRDGEFHKISVRVKRPGLTVRTRRGYLASTAAEAPRVTPTSIDELTQALRNPIPRRGVAIAVAATPVGSVKTAGTVLLTASANAEAVPADASVDVAFRIIDAGAGPWPNGRRGFRSPPPGPTAPDVPSSGSPTVSICREDARRSGSRCTCPAAGLDPS
jgi:hypothetical protein